MRSKPPPPHTGSTAFKPFITEYRVSYKDPAPTKGKYSGKREIMAKTMTHNVKPKAAASQMEKLSRVEPVKVELPPIPRQAATPFQSTSLTLPGMVTGGYAAEKRQTRRRRILEPPASSMGAPQRYNIISGAAIEGEPASGFKEGRRAFVRTFAHFDAVTNARTPGYNIITGHDAVGLRNGQGQSHSPVQHESLATH